VVPPSMKKVPLQIWDINVLPITCPDGRVCKSGWCLQKKLNNPEGLFFMMHKTKNAE